MNDFESNESLKQKIEDLKNRHLGYYAQIQHTDTPLDLKAKFKELDIELNKEFVEVVNYFYRKNELRYVAMPGEWATIRTH